MKMRFLLVLEHLEPILKRCRPAFAEAPARRTRLRQAGLRAGRPKSFSAGPPTPLDLAFPWISITKKEMLTGKVICSLAHRSNVLLPVLSGEIPRSWHRIYDCNGGIPFTPLEIMPRCSLRARGPLGRWLRRGYILNNSGFRPVGGSTPEGGV